MGVAIISSNMNALISSSKILRLIRSLDTDTYSALVELEFELRSGLHLGFGSKIPDIISVNLLAIKPC